VKGDKHAQNAPRKLRVPRIGETQLEQARDYVRTYLTTARLEQGLAYLEEMGHEISKKSTGTFLGFIAQDIKSEHLHLLPEGLLWTDVHGLIAVAAREWYFDFLARSAL
jgi:hypothetical protein